MTGIADLKVSIDFLQSILSLGKHAEDYLGIDPALRQTYPANLNEMYVALREEFVATILREGQYAVFNKEQRDRRRAQPMIDDHAGTPYPRGSMGFTEELCTVCDAKLSVHNNLV